MPPRLVTLLATVAVLVAMPAAGQTRYGSPFGAVAPGTPTNQFGEFYSRELYASGINEHHAGTDMLPASYATSPTCTSASACTVFPIASGTVQKIEYVAGGKLCGEGNLPSGATFNNHNFGNVVIVKHDDGRYSLYGHLDCIEASLRAGQRVTGSTSSSRTPLGRMGRSGSTRYDPAWNIHLHLEVKSLPTLGSHANDSGNFGYTPDFPLSYPAAYEDPRAYLLGIGDYPWTSIAPKAFRVSDGPANVRADPRGLTDAFTTIRAGAYIVATGRTSDSAWYLFDMPGAAGPTKAWIAASVITAEPGATITQVHDVDPLGLRLRDAAGSSGYLIAWDKGVGCSSSVRIWDGQYFVSRASSAGWRQIDIPNNHYVLPGSAACASTLPIAIPAGLTQVWASDTYLNPIVASVNGACGAANGVSVRTAPSANLCSAGIASGVSGSGPWAWTCQGSNGGSNASCSAPATPGSLYVYAQQNGANLSGVAVALSPGDSNGKTSLTTPSSSANRATYQFNTSVSAAFPATAPGGQQFASFQSSCIAIPSPRTCVVLMNNDRDVVATYAAPAQATPAGRARGDFNGDRRSDIVWRNSQTGEVYRILMNGVTPTSATLVWREGNLNWGVVGDADFNGDGINDLLWRSSATGQIFITFFNSAGVAAGGGFAYTEPNLNWRIVATPDINGDGKADLLWWNQATGEVFFHLMNGLVPIGGGKPWREPNLNWRIVASGDFAGSGKENQLVWRNVATGQLFMMTLVPGGQSTGAVFFGEANLNWKVIAAADFNGDGRTDLLWRNGVTGQLYALLLNGMAPIGGGLFYTEPNTSWKVVAVGDYNGDGRTDLLWRNEATGWTYITLLNGLAPVGGGFAWFEPNQSWKVIGPYLYAQ